MEKHALNAELELPLAKTLQLHTNVSLNSNFLVHNVFLFVLNLDNTKMQQESAFLVDQEHRAVPVILKHFLATQDLTKMQTDHVVLTVHQLDIITFKIQMNAPHALMGQLFV